MIQAKQSREGKAKDYEIILEESGESLLDTIKMPLNLRFLQERLPKSNYGHKRSENNAISNRDSESEYSTFD